MKTHQVPLSLVLVIFVLFNSAASRQGLSEHAWPDHPDAEWWGKLTAGDKAIFVQGYTSATSTIAGMRVVEAPMCKGTVSAMMDAISRRYDFADIPVGRYVTELNEFYQKSSNRNVMVGDAMFYVRDEAWGVSPSILEKELETPKHWQ